MGVSGPPRVKSCCVFENERGNAFYKQLNYLDVNDVRIYISISIKKRNNQINCFLLKIVYNQLYIW